MVNTHQIETSPQDNGLSGSMSGVSTEGAQPHHKQGQDVEKNQGTAGVVDTPDKPEPRDPNVVDWDGPDDPENPLNWSFPRKAMGVSIVSAITFLSPLASSIFAPGIPQVMADFHSTNQQVASFIVSVYVLGYTFGPLAISPLSEIYGRAPLYNICNVIFIIFTVACALSPNLAALIVFRLIAGLAGSCPMAVGAGSIADMVRREQRGKVMAAWVFGPLLGPVIGPIAGGYLTQAKGWRWSFWVLTIASGVVTVLTFFFLKETYPLIILQRRTEKLRKESGNEKLRSALDTGQTKKDVFKTAIVRPTKMLLFSPIVFLLSLYMLILYGYLYLLFTAFPALFEGKYGFSTGQVGLSYLGIGIGSAAGLAVSGALSDRLVRILTEKNNGIYKPEYRLPLMVIAGVAVPISLFWFGWTAEQHKHWILPIVGTSFMGFGMTLAFMSISIYLIDAYGLFAASAVGASTVLRSLGGAVLPLAGGKMFDSLGFGWGSSLLAFIALAMIPVPVIFYRYGERIRSKNLFNKQF